MQLLLGLCLLKSIKLINFPFAFLQLFSQSRHPFLSLLMSILKFSDSLLDLGVYILFRK